MKRIWLYYYRKQVSCSHMVQCQWCRSSQQPERPSLHPRWCRRSDPWTPHTPQTWGNKHITATVSFSSFFVKGTQTIWPRYKYPSSVWNHLLLYTMFPNWSLVMKWYSCLGSSYSFRGLVVSVNRFFFFLKHMGHRTQRERDHVLQSELWEQVWTDVVWLPGRSLGWSRSVSSVTRSHRLQTALTEPYIYIYIYRK